MYRDANRRIASHSYALNLNFYWDGAEFGITDPSKGKSLLDLPEANRAIADANRTIEAERQAHLEYQQTAEAEIRRLREENARLREERDRRRRQ